MREDSCLIMYNVFISKEEVKESLLKDSVLIGSIEEVTV